MDSAIKTISSLFALAAFGIAVVSGIAAKNSASTVLSNALICMVLCRVLGWFLGATAVKVATNEILAYHRNNPIPDMSTALSGGGGEAARTGGSESESTKSSQSG